MSYVSDLQIILDNEGGKSDNPADPGGRTNRGITQRTFDAWLLKHSLPPQDVWTITDQQTFDIYKEEYWYPSGCEAMNEPLALVVFDSAVNCGVPRAKQFLENAKKEVGPGLALFVLDIRQSFYNELVHRYPRLLVFLRGWTNRVNRLRQLCLQSIES